ncbi:MAG: carbon-nitrogen hydrolase family protein [Bacteroidetes bacterium]|nr:carbon-nitrogen hydrolase family protein [Bacteroidota bacterium]
MRNVKIATTSFLVDDRYHTVDLNVDRALAYVREAAVTGADVVCLPEMVTTTNVPAELAYHAEDYPGAYTDAFRQEAKRSRVNLIAPYLVRDGNDVFNQASVIDRDGEVVGVYRKVQPTGEESRHIKAGSELPVFQLDFGKIAVMICMDIYFPEIVRIYALKGAEIVFWPTVTHGPTQEALRTQLSARALDNSVVMVEANLAGHPPYAPYAGRFRPATGRIVDHNGDIVAQTGRRHGLAHATVDLDEVRQTSGCVLIREPDHFREDLESIARLDLYASEYLALSEKQDRYY